MKEDLHERARRVMDRLAVEGPAGNGAERAWLETHLSICAACAARQLATERTLAALGNRPWPAALLRPAVVAATQRSVRARAQELRQQAALRRPLWVACSLSWLWMLVTTPYFWRGFAWLGGLMGMPGPVWQAAFLMAWFLPASIVGAVVAWRELHRRAEIAGEAESEMRRL